MDTVKSIKDVFTENAEGKLVLPNFQRGFQWKAEDQKKLLSTVLSMLPIGSILLLKGKTGQYATRPLCYTKNKEPQKEECYYLLDGQQRMSTLRSLFSNLFEGVEKWQENHEDLYPDLRYRWFLDMNPQDTQDIFGYENLRFHPDDIKSFEPSQFLEHIKVFKITTRNKKEWYHPSYTNGLKGNQLKNHIAEMASREGLIPLYDIYNTINRVERPSLLEKTLEKIVSKRRDELKAEVQDGKKNFLDVLDLELEGFEEENLDKHESEIESMWHNLGSEWKAMILSYLTSLLDQQMHAIQLPEEEIQRAIAIFESINRGGISLNTFDLIVAKAARTGSGETLNERVLNRLKEEINLPNALIRPLKGSVQKTWSSSVMKTVEGNKIANPIKDQFLNVLSFFSHVNYESVESIKVDLTKKGKQLSLTPSQVEDNADTAIKSIIRACAFLHFRCGKININDLHNKLMLLPLAYLLKVDEVWESEESLAKLEYWYWSSLFGGAYRERQNQRSVEDVKALYKWINNEIKHPFKNRKDNILSNQGYSDLQILLNEDEENSLPPAVNRGILEYVLSNQPRDFVLNKETEVYLSSWDAAAEQEITFNEDEIHVLKLEDHHIYPLGAAKTVGQSSKELRKKSNHILNSPLNRTYISSYTNSLISSHSPDKYIALLQDLTLWGHSIDTNLNWQNEKELSDNQYYKEILTSRYNELKRNIQVELDELIRTKN